VNAPKWGTEVRRVEIEKKRAKWEGGGKPNVHPLESIDIEAQSMQEVKEV